MSTDKNASKSSAPATKRDEPWIFRTYAGHSTAAKSNELYRGNLAKGQTGLSIAFDLPTQTGYDSDHELARGEVGKVGVPVTISASSVFSVQWWEMPPMLGTNSIAAGMTVARICAS